MNSHEVRSPILELENHVNNACALLEVMSNELSKHRENLSDELGGSVAVGLLQLSHQASLELKRGYEKSHQQWHDLWLATKN